VPIRERALIFQVKDNLVVGVLVQFTKHYILDVVVS